MKLKGVGSVLAVALLGACAPLAPPKKAAPVRINQDPYPSTYNRYPGALTVIRNATIFDGEGGRIEGGTVVLEDGVVQAVGGPDTAVPAGPHQIDGTGKFVTPGIIDVHSHLVDYPSPGTPSHSDGNEATSPVRASTTITWVTVTSRPVSVVVLAPHPRTQLSRWSKRGTMSDIRSSGTAG